MESSTNSQAAGESLNQSDTTAVVKVFTKNQVNFAAFFATALGAAYLLKKNYEAIGKPEEGKKVLWQGIALLLAVAVFLMLLPETFTDKVSGVTVGFLWVVLAELYFREYQKEAVEGMIAAGTPVRSNWRVFLIILTALLLIVVLLFLLAVVVVSFTEPPLNQTLRP